VTEIAGTDVSKETVRWGVLGAAAIAVQRTMPALSDAPSAHLLALASRDREKGAPVAQALGIPKLYTSYDALLEDDDIDAVYVTLPNRLHFEWSVRAMEAGKHVLCEKPLCLSAQEVRKLCDTRERTGKYIEEAFGYRNHPQWDAIESILAREDIGRDVAVHATMAKQFLDPNDIRNNPNEGGGAVFDLGSYTVNACNRIFGVKPLRVAAAMERDPAFGTDRLTSVLLEYPLGHAAITVGTQAGTNAWGSHQQLSILGTRGWCRSNFPYAHARPTACQIETGDESTVGTFPARRIEFAPANQYVLQVERISQFILGKPVRSYPIEDSLDTAETIEAIFAAARNERWQEVGRGD
jgi:predicted dehydrogenase